MATFKLDYVKGRLRPVRLVRATTEATGKKGTVKQVTEVELNLELGGEGDIDKSFDKSIEALWPGVGDLCKRIAAEDEQGGCDLSARSKLPDLTIDLFPTPEAKKAVFHLPASVCRGRPKLKVTEDGMATLVIRLAGRFGRDELAKLVAYLEADVWLSCAPAQVDMTELVEAKGEPEKAKAFRGSKKPKPKKQVENGEAGAPA